MKRDDGGLGGKLKHSSAPAFAGRTVCLRGIRKAFGNSEVLAGLDLDLQAGCIYVLLGEEGEGKSTLLAILAGTLMPDEGRGLVLGAMLGVPSRIATLPGHLPGDAELILVDGAVEEALVVELVARAARGATVVVAARSLDATRLPDACVVWLQAGKVRLCAPEKDLRRPHRSLFDLDTLAEVLALGARKG